jgi:DNA-binding IclR family transcriptional regulator
MPWIENKYLYLTQTTAINHFFHNFVQISGEIIFASRVDISKKINYHSYINKTIVAISILIFTEVKMIKEKMPGLKRGLKILSLCSECQDGISFNELRRQCDNLAATTLARILEALLESKMLKKDSQNGKYFLDSAFMEIAGKTMKGRNRGELIQPVLDALTAEIMESSAYFDWTGNLMQLLAKTETYNSFHYMSPLRTWGPLPHDPFGMVCLAQNHELEDFKKIISGPGNFYAPPDILEKDFLFAKEHKYLIRERNILKRTNVIRFVAPVFAGTNGTVIGSVGATMIKRELEPDEEKNIIEKIINAAARATELMTACV